MRPRCFGDDHSVRFMSGSGRGHNQYREVGFHAVCAISTWSRMTSTADCLASGCTFETSHYHTEKIGYILCNLLSTRPQSTTTASSTQSLPHWMKVHHCLEGDTRALQKYFISCPSCTPTLFVNENHSELPVEHVLHVTSYPGWYTLW